MKNKDKRPKNKNNQPHGCWVRYCYKGNFINGDYDGYWEWYYNDGELDYKRYFIEI